MLNEDFRRRDWVLDRKLDHESHTAAHKRHRPARSLPKAPERDRPTAPLELELVGPKPRSNESRPRKALAEAAGLGAPQPRLCLGGVVTRRRPGAQDDAGSAEVGLVALSHEQPRLEALASSDGKRQK